MDEISKDLNDLKLRLTILEKDCILQNKNIENIQTKIEEDYKDLKNEFKDIKSSIDEMKHVLSSAKGGWKVLIIIGTVITGVIAVIKVILDATK